MKRFSFQRVVEIVADGFCPGLSPTVEMPTIVCLCGSTRFSEAFKVAAVSETLAGKIVLTANIDFKRLPEHGIEPEQAGPLKIKMDELHKRKIDLADEVLVLNVGDYMGPSTLDELAYARCRGKKVRFLEPRSYER